MKQPLCIGHSPSATTLARDPESLRPKFAVIVFNDEGRATHSSVAGNTRIKTPNFDLTFMATAGLMAHPQTTGRNLATILRPNRSDPIEGRDTTLAGQERHEIDRPHYWGCSI
ncbi:MAG: hypothetical protein IAE82_16120 [Opitutaceae bacterium]|nr:hypothetical protein [Opitutaceae bacterium]